MPVFTIGTIKLAKTRPMILFLFFNKLKANPDKTPAKVVFKRQTITVPIGLIGINMASVDGENSAIMPLKKPRIAPDNGPYKTAAITIVINDKLMLTGPNWR